MSWSISKTAGAPAKVRDHVAPQFDNAAKYYAGTSEEKDVISAKDSVLTWLAGAEARMPDKGVIVEASGSRGDGWLTIRVDCGTLDLKV